MAESKITCYGIPEWIRQQAVDRIVLYHSTKVYYSSDAASCGKTPAAVYPAGIYHVYKRKNGCINITPVKGRPGGWLKEP